MSNTSTSNHHFFCFTIQLRYKRIAICFDDESQSGTPLWRYFAPHASISAVQGLPTISSEGGTWCFCSGEGALPLVQLSISFIMSCFEKHKIYFYFFSTAKLKVDWHQTTKQLLHTQSKIPNLKNPHVDSTQRVNTNMKVTADSTTLRFAISSDHLD